MIVREHVELLGDQSFTYQILQLRPGHVTIKYPDGQCRGKYTSVTAAYHFLDAMTVHRARAKEWLQ